MVRKETTSRGCVPCRNKAIRMVIYMTKTYIYQSIAKLKKEITKGGVKCIFLINHFYLSSY